LSNCFPWPTSLSPVSLITWVIFVVSADGIFQDFMTTHVIATSSGLLGWMFPAVVKVYCTMDVHHVPFDKQQCQIAFISWAFHGHKLNVTYNETEPQTIYYTGYLLNRLTDNILSTTLNIYYMPTNQVVVIQALTN